MGLFLAAAFAAIIGFAMLPLLVSNSFFVLSVAIGVYLVPIGALVTQSWQRAMFSAMASYVVALLGPTNPMSYDTVNFYNSALAIVVGGAATALSFRLLPLLAPAFRTRRLQALTLRDLRRVAMGRTPNDWEGHIRGRLSAMPDEATPLQRAQVLAALSVGTEIIRLRPIARRLGLGTEIESALASVAQANSATAIARLVHIDELLAARPGTALEVVRARSSILALSEALTQHADFFAAGAPS